MCGRIAGAAESASSEARQLRDRVDQLTSMHKTMFGRMLRLAVLALQNQVVLSTVLCADGGYAYLSRPCANNSHLGWKPSPG